MYGTAGESLYALDVSDGAERWGDTIGADPSSPIPADDVIAVAGGKTVHVFTPDGASTATADLTGDVVSTPAVVGSTLYAATDAGTVYAFDVEQSGDSVTLTERWTTSTVIDRRPTVTVSGGRVIVTGASPGEGKQGRVYALSADTGEELWAFTTTNWIESAAAIDGDTVYVGVSNGDVVALTAESGAERWRFDANNSWSFLYWGPGVTGGLVVADDTVYVGSEDGNLYAIDAESGTSKWRFSTGNAVVSTPTVVDGIAFVGNTGGVLSAITSPETTPVPLDGGTGETGVVGDSDDRNTGDGGFLGFSLARGVRGLITSPVTLLILTIGLIYGIATIVLNDSDNGDATSTGPAVEVQSTQPGDTGTTSSVPGDPETGEDTPGKPAGSGASTPPDEVPDESGSDDTGDELQRTELLDELRELDRKWSDIDRKLLYSVGDHHPDTYEATFGSLDAALDAAGVTDTATADSESGSEPAVDESPDEDHLAGDSPDGDASERERQFTHLRDRVAECASAADRLAAQLSSAPPDTPPVADTQTASPASNASSEPADSDSTAAEDSRPAGLGASDHQIDSRHNRAGSDTIVRTVDEINETARHAAPVALQLQEHLTEDGRRHVFRAVTVGGESVQLDVWNRHVDAFNWEPGAWYVFESVRGQHWTVNGESGVTVSTTPDVTITRRDSLPDADVPGGR